jgi:hypothetical protein
MKRNPIPHPMVLAGITACLMVILCLEPAPLHAQMKGNSTYQQIWEQAEHIYETSRDILNGEKYNYPYRSAVGTPFFEIPGDPLASIWYRGKVYENQHIRYDLYNQIMVLDYTDVAGARGSLVLKHEWIGQVVIGGFLFRPFKDEEGSDRFGQVIGSGNYTIVHFWEKQYLPDMHGGEGHYLFPDPVRSSYLVLQGVFRPYRGNGSLIKCFPPELRSEVRGYLKKQRTRVKHASDQDLEALLVFVNQLADHEG